MRFLSAGDAALVVEFGNTIDKHLIQQVNQLRSHVHKLIDLGLVVGVCETIPTFRSLAIVFDPLKTSADALRLTLEERPIPLDDSQSSAGRTWQLPVCYGGEFGPDLDAVAQSKHLSSEEVIDIHLSATYQVYLLGFQPGYGFLGDTDSRLHLPRRTEPRLRVPAGSVAIAMKLTCVYPWDCPAGWHLLGQCPIPMFDASASRPTLLSPNDQVNFTPVNAATFATLENDQRHGRIDWSDWCSEPEQ